MNIKLGQIRLYLFYLLIFALPWQTRWIIRDPYFGGEPWEYGRISLYSWDIILLVLIIVSLPLIWTTIRGDKKQSVNFNFFSFEFWNRSFIFFLLGFFTLASVIWSSDKNLALYWVCRFLEAGLLWWLIYILKPAWVTVCKSLVFAGSLQAVWAIGQFLTQTSFANKWLGVALHPLTQGGTSVVMNEYGRWLRAYAGQVHPNVLGGLLVMTLLATIWVYVEKAKLKSGKIYLFLFFIQLIGLFFTFSRGAWIALFVSIVWWLWKEGEERVYLKKIFVMSGVVIVCLGIIYWQPVSGRFSGASSLEQRSIEDRKGSIRESQYLLRDNLLLGVGVGNYTFALAQSKPSLPAWRYQPVHNIFLLVLTELGVFGLALWLFVVGGFMKAAHFRSKYIVFIIPIFFIALFDHYWWTAPSMFLLFWLMFFSNYFIREQQP